MSITPMRNRNNFTPVVCDLVVSVDTNPKADQMVRDMDRDGVCVCKSPIWSLQDAETIETRHAYASIDFFLMAKCTRCYRKSVVFVTTDGDEVIIHGRRSWRGNTWACGGDIDG